MISWKKAWQPIPVSVLENFMDRGAGWGPWDRKESDTTEWLTPWPNPQSYGHWEGRRFHLCCAWRPWRLCNHGVCGKAWVAWGTHSGPLVLIVKSLPSLLTLHCWSWQANTAPRPSSVPMTLHFLVLELPPEKVKLERWGWKESFVQQARMQSLAGVDLSLEEREVLVAHFWS